MSLKRIFRILRHPTTIKIVGVIAIVGFLFIIPTFAIGETTNSETMDAVQKFLKTVLSLCSWLWIMLAIMAGKLMSNDFVYGTFLSLDTYLRKIRNIMKNLANFGLVAIILGSIIKSLIGKENLNPKKIIISALVAGILIQASRFLVGALVDLSTVATAAMSSFSNSFIPGNPEIKNNMNTNISEFKRKKIKIDPNKAADEMVSTETIDLNPGSNNDDFTDLITPTYNSISGPFIHLGMGVFKFQTYLETEQTPDSLATLSFSFALRLFIILAFTVALLLMFIANIMRVGLIWIFVIGSSIMVLMVAFKDFFKGGEGGSSGGFGKLFTLSNLIAIVLKPVIFVSIISLMLIIVASMETSMGQSSFKNLNGATFAVDQSGNSSMTIEGVSTVSVTKNDLLGPSVLNVEAGQDFFSLLVTLLLELFLVRWMVKLSLTLGGGPIEKTMEGLLEKAEKLAKYAPILPIAGGASVNALGLIKEQQTTNLLKGFGMNRQGKFSEAEREFEATVSGWMGTKRSWNSQDWAELDVETLKTGGGTLFSKPRDFGEKRLGGLSVANTTWKGRLETRLDKQGIASGLFKDTGFKGKDTFESFFKGTDDNDPKARENRWALHQQMGGNDASYNKTKWTGKGVDVPTYNQLLENKYFTREGSTASDGTE